MDTSTKYNPSAVEDKWYSYWLDHKFFHSEPDSREPYTIVIPPPNVTGILHMGHVLNNTLNDVLIRNARMHGKNACWVPGTDHASIATESKVVAKLKAGGISKESLTREEFLKYAWEWKEEHGGIILKQLRKLGASCDWDRTRFTMDPDMSEAVIRTFVYFYKKGLIYKGVRMVNWDPVGLTAVSDEEVVHRDTKSHFYHLRYYVSDGCGNPTDKYLVIATTRPETIMADAAICVNPADERHHWLRGKKVLIPLINREIPVIEDSYVEMDFGTGCLKVTPAHDVNDYEIGMRHNLPVIDIIDDHGRLNEAAQILIGEDRFMNPVGRGILFYGSLQPLEHYIQILDSFSFCEQVFVQCECIILLGGLGVMTEQGSISPAHKEPYQTGAFGIIMSVIIIDFGLPYPLLSRSIKWHRHRSQIVVYFTEQPIYFASFFAFFYGFLVIQVLESVFRPARHRIPIAIDKVGCGTVIIVNGKNKHRGVHSLQILLLLP